MTKLSRPRFGFVQPHFATSSAEPKRRVSSSPRASMSKENPLKKVASAINPFFLWFTTPYTMGVLVGAVMVMGVGGGFVANLQCKTVTSVDTRYEKFSGDLVTLKIFVESLHARPQGLPESGDAAPPNPALQFFSDADATI